jgi:predicted O-methyltransferase YrrM
MNPRLAALVDQLYTEGVAHDAAQPDRLLKRRNLEPETAKLLALVVRMIGARSVVE